jgi:hypothetical protein
MRTRISLSLVAVLAGFAPLLRAKPAHPEPRVIVNVISVEGPHPRAEVERSLRLGWGRIVRCYESRGGRSKGKLDLKLGLSSHGQVKTASVTGSTLNNAELTTCLIAVVQGLSVPRADADSKAISEIRLAPGDRT